MVPVAGTLIQIAEKVSAGLPLIVYQVQAQLFGQFILAGPCDEKLCVCLGTNGAGHTDDGQRTTCRSQFSPLTMGLPGAD